MWRGLKSELDRVAARCAACEFICGTDLAAAIQEVRNASGRATEGMIAFRRAVDGAKDRGVCRAKTFCGPVAECIVRLAACLPWLFPDGLPVLVKGETNEAFLTRRQCAAIVAAAVFGVLPDPRQFGDMGDFELGGLLDTDEEKALCLVAYFHRIGTADDGFLDEVVSFGRRSGQPRPHQFWMGLDKPLRKARIKDGPVEQRHGCLQAAFGNEFLGGGVLEGCAAQEEIRFATCPECLVGRFISERALTMEVLVITGAVQYAQCTGSGSRLRFGGPFKDDPWGPPDEERRRGPQVVSMDPLAFPRKEQYEPPQVLRELMKASLACEGDPLDDDSGASKQPSRPPFATGNWGCGILGGDPQLKVLIQWLAASASDREMHYCPFEDERLVELPEAIQAVWDSGATCKDLYKLLYGHKKKRGVFKGLLKNIEALTAAGVLVPRPPEPEEEAEAAFAEADGAEGGGEA